MVKDIQISYQEEDESLLMALFNKLGVRVRRNETVLDEETEQVRNVLQNKFVETGWSSALPFQSRHK